MKQSYFTNVLKYDQGQIINKVNKTAHLCPSFCDIKKKTNFVLGGINNEKEWFILSHAYLVKTHQKDNFVISNILFLKDLALVAYLSRVQLTVSCAKYTMARELKSIMYK